MPIAVEAKARLKKRGRKFKFAVIQKPKEEFPKHLLGETVEEAESLFKEYSKTLNDLARSYARMSGLERTDLFGETIMGLARAKRDFDPTRSDDFKTFAIFKIKDALNKYVRGFSAPVRVPAYIKKVNRWIDNLEALLKCAMVEPEDIEAILAGEKAVMLSDDPLQKDCDKLSTMISDEAARLKVTRKELIKRARILPHTYSEMHIEEQADEPEFDDKLLVDKLKSHMTDTELTISNMIMDGKTYKEIAAAFGHKPPWVRQQLDKMRDRFLKMLGGKRP